MKNRSIGISKYSNCVQVKWSIDRSYPLQVSSPLLANTVKLIPSMIFFFIISLSRKLIDEMGLDRGGLGLNNLPGYRSSVASHVITVCIQKKVLKKETPFFIFSKFFIKLLKTQFYVDFYY